ncbi:MAG: hypothetical protein OXG94_02715, partial [Bacteroidetes bacterium]|nr:hypothetical protein [Bacteroidota bacterium]
FPRSIRQNQRPKRAKITPKFYNPEVLQEAHMTNITHYEALAKFPYNVQKYAYGHPQTDILL